MAKKKLALRAVVGPRKERRIVCVVPFCGRSTARAEFDEWICGEHWRLVPRRSRQVYGRHVRRWRRFGPPGYEVAAQRCWAWIKRVAIERAVGL